jgi:hypothetical protein
MDFEPDKLNPGSFERIFLQVKFRIGRIQVEKLHRRNSK